jgi:uncharacterized UBP type Zn finger protein
MQGGATLPDFQEARLQDDGQSRVADEPCLLPLPHLGGRHGLLNLGNTCFLNAALQTLLHTEPLIHLMTSDHVLATASSSSSSTPEQRAVAAEFTTIARRMCVLPPSTQSLFVTLQLHVGA